MSAKIVTLPNTKRAGGNIKVLRSVGQNPKVKVEEKFSIADFAETNKQFNAFWDLMDTVEKHGYLRASMSVIGRSTVGTWWTLRKNEQNQTGLASDAKPIQAKRLQEFYSPSNRSWDNISDFHTIAYKLMIGAMYLRYFGQAAYLILRNKIGIFFFYIYAAINGYTFRTAKKGELDEVFRFRWKTLWEERKDSFNKQQGENCRNQRR